MEADLRQKSLEKKCKKLEKARKCTGPTRPAAYIVKPNPTRARISKIRPNPSPQKPGSKPPLNSTALEYLVKVLATSVDFFSLPLTNTDTLLPRQSTLPTSIDPSSEKERISWRDCAVEDTTKKGGNYTLECGSSTEL